MEAISNYWGNVGTSNICRAKRDTISMNEKLLHLLNGHEQLYPINLEERFPRVMDRIADLWESEEIDDYFTDLMMNTRGGTRQGFPPKVASKIFSLSMAHAKLHVRKLPDAAGFNPWDNEEVSKKSAIEHRGYAFSAKGFIQSAEKGDRKALAVCPHLIFDLTSPN